MVPLVPRPSLSVHTDCSRHLDCTAVRELVISALQEVARTDARVGPSGDRPPSQLQRRPPPPQPQVTSPQNPSASGDEVTFTATVTSGSPATPVTTGQRLLQIRRDFLLRRNRTQAAQNVNTSGQATFATSSLGMGSHAIWAATAALRVPRERGQRYPAGQQHRDRYRSGLLCQPLEDRSVGHLHSHSHQQLQPRHYRPGDL